MADIFTTSGPFAARYQRFECKYLINEDQVQGIREHIRAFTQPDPYAKKAPDGCYVIQSLYLDGPDLRLFRETQEGVKKRLKLRIRCYSDCDSLPVYMEIKRRYNGLVLKARARTMRDAAGKMLSGYASDITHLADEEKACYEEFVSWVGRWTAQPVVWVKYRREAYVGALQPGIRITMDRNLVFAPSTGPMKPVPSNMWNSIEQRRVVLELKFNKSFPDWMKSLVQRFNLRRQSYSKYGNAILRGMDAWIFPASYGPHANERSFREHS